MTIKKKLFFPKIIQTGRSMIEMLAVLAIIGVLSVLVIAAYRTAISKFKANNTIHDANLIAESIMTSNQMERAEVEEFLTFSEYAKTESGYTFESVKETEEVFSVSALNVPKSVCNRVIEMKSSDFAVSVNNVGYDTFTNQNTCLTENKINFYYDVSNTVKCGGRICYGGKVCQSEECVCPADTTFVNGKCTCNAGKPNQCGTECFAACAAGEFDCGSKQCICPEPTHQRYPVNGQCVCPPGKEEGGDGKCHTNSCRGGTSGQQDWTCMIDDQRCGYQCTEDGLTCKYGVCDKGVCPANTTHAYHLGKNVFGCKDAQNVICMYNGSVIYCYPSANETNACGNACKLNGGCAYGICDPSLCPEGMTFARMFGGAGYGGAYSCSNGQISCTKSSSTIVCATSDGAVCGKGCTYAGICTGIPNFCPKAGCESWEYLDTATNECKAVCPTGTTYSKPSGSAAYRCTRSDGVYCVLSSNSATYCYFPTGGKYCGSACTMDANNCSNGTCNPSDCPSDLIHQYVGPFAGCYNPDTGIGCSPQYGGWRCYKNGSVCSGTCTDYYGNGCCQDLVCPAGTTNTIFKDTSGYSYNACYNPAYDTTCTSGKYCYRQGIQCGTGCNLDGTGCTSAKKCVETDCPAGQTLMSSDWLCHVVDVVCESGNCAINGANCGSGCQSDGHGCDYGICVASDCPSDTYLAKVNTSAYACKNNSGISCYKEDGKYSCTKGGTLCASGCKTFTAQQRFECEYDTCDS